MDSKFSLLTLTLSRAREAADCLASASGAVRNDFLRILAASLAADFSPILSANQEDLKRARKKEAAPAVLDRLLLDSKRLKGLIDGLRSCVTLPDPIGRIEDFAAVQDGL